MPSSTDWYSSADWGPEAEKEFEAKLRRARNKGEYLRVKGVTLIQQQDKARRQAGRSLLLRLVRDFPDTPTVSWAWEHLAEAEEADGRYEEAEQNYREALAAYPRRPGIRGHAAVKLAGLIAATRQPDKYAEASALLDAHGAVWKIEQFWAHLARARMAADRGDGAEASSHARAALALHADAVPRAPRHPEVGHVRTDAETLRELEALARA
jgi:tetratricopeptide (TPR) repeat protein